MISMIWPLALLPIVIPLAQAIPPALILAGGWNRTEVAILEFEFTSGNLSLKGYTTGGDEEEKSWISRHPNNPNLVVVANDRGEPGFLTSFSLDPSTGEIAFIDRVDTGGHPTPDGIAATHTAFYPNGEAIAVANYYGQTVATFLFNPTNGTFGEQINTDSAILDFGNYTRKQGQVPGRQDIAHPHQILFHPYLPILYVPDLGQDLVHRFLVSEDGSGTLSALEGYEQPLASGPRHATISSDGKWLYLLQELSVTVSVFSIDTSDESMGNLTLVQEGVPIYPSNATLSPSLSASAIRVSNDGRFLYASNRNFTGFPSAPLSGEPPDSISVFAIGNSSSDGFISRTQSAFIPNSRLLRAMEISPPSTTPNAGGEDFIVVGGQTSTDIHVLRRNRRNGGLEWVSSVEVDFMAASFIWV